MARPLEYKLFKDGGFPFSNDKWNEANIGLLMHYVSQQPTDVERTGLFVGPGCLPYMLAYLGISQAVLLDKSPYVPAAKLKQMEILMKNDDWDPYHDEVEAVTDAAHLNSCRRERHVVEHSELAIGYMTTREAAATVDFVVEEGDILVTLPRVATRLREQKREASFLNLTNVASYLDPTGFWTRAAAGDLAEAVGELPLCESAVVLDSSQSHSIPIVMPAAEYVANHGIIPEYLTRRY